MKLSAPGRGLLPAAPPVSVDYVVTASIRIGDHLTIVADGESPEVGSVDVVANGTHAAVAKHELTNARMIAAKLARIPGPRVSLRSIEQKQVERANLLISRDSMMEDALTAESETMATPTGNPWVIFRYEVGMLYALIPYLEVGNEVYMGLPVAIKNAVTESALLHVRILAEMFKIERKKKDDILLKDLIDKHGKPPAVTMFESTYGDANTEGCPCWQINKLLAHPTKHRKAHGDASQLLNSLLPSLCEAITEVFACASDLPHGLVSEPQPDPN